jgi:hypothetical protein
MYLQTSQSLLGEVAEAGRRSGKRWWSVINGSKLELHGIIAERERI